MSSIKSPNYEPKQLIKSFKMGIGEACRAASQKTCDYQIAEKQREQYLANPKKASDFGAEVIMAGESVRVNLYNANDRDAVNWGIYYERVWTGKI